MLFAPVFFWQLSRQQWDAIHGRALAALIGLTVFATIGAFFCFNYALARLSASKTSIFLNCVPVITGIGAWGILGERLTIVQIIGGALVLFSVYLTNLPAKEEPTLQLEQEGIQLT